MKKVFARALTLALLSVTLFTACKKEDVLKPQPTPPVVTPPAEGHFTVKLKAAITVGDVVYDSIPATFRITSWDENGVQHQKDTALSAGAQEIKLPKGHSRFAFYVNKWGVEDELVLQKNQITEGGVYTLSGNKEAKKLQSVAEFDFANGAFVPSLQQNFLYDAQGRIKEITALAPATPGGALTPGSKSEFLYEGNKLRVNNVSETNGVKTIWYHHAYTFDVEGRIIQSEYRYLTEHHIYTNQYNSSGITMLMGENATNTNGSQILLQFNGGNRVIEKTIIPNLTNTEKRLAYDFNINPYMVIKMPSLHFEHSSKNNVVSEAWEGQTASLNEYSYDADGYVTQVISKSRNNSGEYVIQKKTVYTY